MKSNYMGIFNAVSTETEVTHQLNLQKVEPDSKGQSLPSYSDVKLRCLEPRGAIIKKKYLALDRPERQGLSNTESHQKVNAVTNNFKY